MPFDVAFGLDDDDLLVWTIIVGEQQGGVWDWNAMNWRKND